VTDFKTCSMFGETPGSHGWKYGDDSSALLRRVVWWTLSDVSGAMTHRRDNGTSKYLCNVG
jgi:hypothetical protein